MNRVRAAVYDVLASFSRRTPTFVGGSGLSGGNQAEAVADIAAALSKRFSEAEGWARVWPSPSATSWRIEVKPYDPAVLHFLPLESEQQKAGPPIGYYSFGERRIDLTDADLSGCDLSNSVLPNAVLTRARLTGAKLEGADWSGSTMFRIQAEEATMVRANLSGAILIEAVLRSASLQGTNLSGADMSDAQLQDATLTEADLTGAKLSGADVSGANFERTQLPQNFDPSTVVYDDRTVWPWGPVESRLF